jgi:hypothetical protein
MELPNMNRGLVSFQKAAHAALAGAAYRKSGYLTTLLWGDVGSSRNLTLIPLRSIEVPRVAGREQVKFPTSPHKKRGEIWGTRLGGIGRHGFSCCPIRWPEKANLDKSG